MSLRTKRSAGADLDLDAQIVELQQRRAVVAAENQHPREDGHEGADEWIASARGYLGSRATVEPFASRSRDLDRDAIIDLVAAWAVSSPEFARWLHERIDAAPATGGSGYAPLGRDERDAVVLDFDAQLAALELERERRRRQSVVDEAQRALAEVEN